MITSKAKLVITSKAKLVITSKAKLEIKIMKKLKIILGVNLVLFASLVFLGIEQAGKGAEIAKLEDDLEIATTKKMNLSEGIFGQNSDKNNQEIAQDLGFVKPSKIYYFSIDAGFAKLPVR